jgi:hypothetical protein
MAGGVEAASGESGEVIEKRVNINFGEAGLFARDAQCRFINLPDAFERLKRT